jgi:hypothetical protein
MSANVQELIERIRAGEDMQPFWSELLAGPNLDALLELVQTIESSADIEASTVGYLREDVHASLCSRRGYPWAEAAIKLARVPANASAEFVRRCRRPYLVAVCRGGGGVARLLC